MSSKKRNLSPVEPPWSRYIQAKGSALGLPMAGNFELTGRCNFNCKMCYVHNSDGSDELTAEQWIDIGRQAVKNGMLYLLLTGGEPLLRKDFKEIYLALKNMGLLISINTNASLIDDEMFEFLKEYKPIRMNISLYGASDETYKKLCGKAKYNDVVKNIKRLHEAGIAIRINASITPYNVQDIEGIYRFGEELGIPVKGTTYMFPPVRVNGCKYGEADHRFEAEEAARFQLKCREQYMTPEQLADNCSVIDMEDNDSYTEGEGSRCRAGKTAFWVTWDGRMLPCGMFPVDGWSIVEHGFMNAWKQVREYVSSLRLPAKCRGCGYKDSCPSCAASCLTEEGATDRCPKYICRMTKTFHEITAKKYKVE